MSRRPRRSAIRSRRSVQDAPLAAPPLRGLAHGALRLSASALVLAAFAPGRPLQADAITADGRTATRVAHQGVTTDITTQTVAGAHGVNTFSRFDVGGGQTVNIHVPHGTAGTINIVNGPRSTIDGAMRSVVSGGETGGALYFANTSGVVVGPGGRIDGGSVSISAPSRAFAEGFIGPDGRPSAANVDHVVQGTAPRADADIAVHGTIAGSQRVRLSTGGRVIVSGNISAGDRAAALGAAVNTGGVGISAGRGIAVHGSARISGMRGEAGGDVQIRSIGTIHIASGAEIRADGVGMGDAGVAIVFGGDAAVLERGALISASALGTGDGGFVELSAIDAVELAGALRAGSVGGRPGSILIDPINFTQTNDLIDNTGAEITITATQKVTIAAGVTISTRVITPAGATATAAEMLTAESDAASGHLTIIAPQIEVQAGANLLTFATGGLRGGDILLSAQHDDTAAGSALPGILPETTVSVDIDSAFLRGRDVTIDVDVSKSNLITSTSAVSDYAAALTDGTMLSFVDDLFAGKLAQADGLLASVTNRQEVAGMPAYTGGFAHVSIRDSSIVSGRDVAISADSAVTQQIAPALQSLSAAIAGSATEARVVIDTTPITAGGTVTITADTSETVDLNTYAGNVATGIGDGSNAAAAISARWNTTEVMINAPAAADGSAGAAIDAGAAVVITATSSKDTSVDAVVAADFQGRGEALAISYDKSRVRVGLGGAVVTDAARLNLVARTDVTRASTRAFVGDIANPVPPFAVGTSVNDALSNWLSTANATLSGALGAVNSALAGTTTASIAATDHSLETVAQFGGRLRFDDPLTGASATLGAAAFDPGTSGTGTARLNLRAFTDVANLGHVSAVQLGSSSDAGNAVIVALASDVWRAETAAEIGAVARIADSTRTLVEAETTLPEVDTHAIRDRQTEIEDAFASPFEFELIPVAYQLPAQAELFDDDAITHLTDARVITPGGVSVAISGGRRTADLTTRAEVISGGTFAGGGADTLTATAGASGGILVRRLVPAEWRDTAAGTRGVGGMAEIVTLNAVTEARIGALGTDDTDVPTEFESVEVAATNDLVLVAGGTSYGEARTFTFNGALVNATYTGSAEALFDARNFVEVPVMTVAAQENGIVAAEGAAGALGGASGVGVAMVRANATRAALARFAAADGSSPGLDEAPDAGTITVLSVAAEVDGISIASASAGAKTTEETGGATGTGVPDFAAWEGDSTVDLGGNGAAHGGPISVQAAADLAWVDDTDTASAIVGSTRRTRTDIAGVTATHAGLALMGAGAATSGARTFGLGGAITRLDSDRIVEARVLNGGFHVPATPSALASFTVRATDNSVQRALGFGRAGNSRGGASVYGSVAWLKSDSTVTAFFDFASGSMPYVEIAASRGGGAIASGGAYARGNDDTDDEEDTASNGVGVGIGVAVLDIAETVTADLIAPPLLAADRVFVTATNTSRNLGLATSNGTGRSYGVTGSGIRGMLDQTTRAGVSGRIFRGTASNGFRSRSDIVLGSFAFVPEFEVAAENNSSLKLWSGSDVDGEKAAFGGSATWVQDRRITEVDLDTFYTPIADADNPPEYVVRALHRGSLEVGQRAGAGEDGGNAGAVSASVVATDWQTRVTIDDASLSQGSSIDISATEAARLTNTQRALSSADKGAGTMGLVVTTYGSVVAVTLRAAGLGTADDDSGFDPESGTGGGGPISVAALSDSTIRAKAVRSGEARQAGAGVFNEMRSTGGTFVTVDTGKLKLFGGEFDLGSGLFGGDVSVTATDSTWREVVASASGTADALGIAGAITHDVYQRDTISTMGDVEIGDLGAVGAYSDIRTTAIAVGRANGGAKVGAALVGVLAKDDRDVVAQSTIAVPFRGGGESGDANGLLEARRTDIMLAMQATEMVATAGAGAGIGTVLTGGRTAATAHVRDFSNVNGTLDILAEDATKSFNLSLGAGQADTIGGSAALSYMRLGRPSDAAAALAENDRGGVERAAADTGRDFLGDAITARRGNTGLFTTSAQEITARLSVSGDADYTQYGTINITALDRRRGYAVAGQLQAGIVGAAGQFIDTHFELTSINASGFLIYIMPFGNGEDDDAETEDEIDTTTAEETSDELEDAKDIADAAAGLGGNATALGAAVSYLRLGGLVEAVLDVAPINQDRQFGPARQNFSGAIMLSARSEAFTAAMGAGAIISAGNAGSATAAMTRQYQQVRARVIGGGSVTTLDPGFAEPVVDLSASTAGKSWAIAAQATLGIGGAAGGATLALNDFDAITEAEILGTEVSAGEQGGSIALEARNDSHVLASGLAGGGGSTVAAGLSVGYAGNKGITAARIAGAVINPMVDTSPVSVIASNTLTLTSLLAQGNIAATAGIGAALSVAKMTGETTADITDSTIGPVALQARLPGGGNVTVRATSDAGLSAAAVGVAGGGTAGVSGSLAITDRADIVRAEIARSRVAVMGDVTVDARATGRFGAAGGGDAGILAALRQANGNFTGAGTAAVGVTVAITKAASNVTARISGARKLEAGGSIAVTARAESEARGLTLTMGGAGTVAASVQVPLFFVETEVIAEIDGSSASNAVEVLAGEDIVLTADTTAEIRSFALTAGGGGAAGAGVDVEYLRMGSLTLARLRNARAEAAGDISVRAETAATLDTNSFAGGGAGAVGLAGIVQVALVETDTQALIEAAEVDAGGDLTLAAMADTTVEQNSGQLAIGGTVGLGGNVLILNGRDIVRAEVVDAATATSANASTLDVAGATDITATATTTVDSAVYGISGGTVGITATIFVTRFEQTVTARLGNHAQFSGTSLTIGADQSFDQSADIGAIGGGFVGIGASIGANSMANSVLAEIGRGAVVQASGNVAVTALGIRDYTGTSVGITGGAFAFSGSILSISYGKPGETEETGPHMDRVSDSVENDDPYGGENGDMTNGDAAIAAYFDQARTGRSALDLARLTSETDAGKDEITARVNDDATVTSGGDITIEAQEGGQVSVTAGSGAGGIVGATAGVISMRRGSTVTAEIGAGTVLEADDDITVAALADVDSLSSRAAPLAFTGAGGLVAVAGAVSRVVAERALDVLVGEGARLSAGDRVTLRANETTLTRANAAGGAGGAIAVGGTVSFARHASTLDISIATGTRPQIDAGRVLIEIRRDGGVEATATAAQAAAIGVSGVDTTAADDARATINLGRLDIDTPGTADIRVFNGGDVEARSTGITVAGIAAQGAFATARRTALSEIRSPQSVRIDAGSLNILAVDAFSESTRSMVDARTTSIAGGIVGSVGGALSDARNESATRIDLILRELDIAGDARIAALGRSGFFGRSTGVTSGLVAFGANRSKIVDTSETLLTLRLDQDAPGDLDVGGTFTAEAVSDQDVENDVTSGQGGVVGISASRVTAELDSTTRARVESVDGSTLSAGTFAVRATHGLALAATGDSFSARVAGAGGTDITSTALADVDVELEGITVEAAEIEVAILADMGKASRRFDGRIGDVGVFVGSALVSETLFDTDMDLLVTNSTLRQSTPGATGVGRATFEVRGDYSGKDAQKIDSGGAVTGASAISEMRADASGRILFDGATVESDGDLTAQVVTDSDLDTEVYVNTYGLAGVPTGDSLATLDAVQTVALANGARLESAEGDVTLAALGDDVNVSSEIRVFNGTAVPITIQPEAESRLDMVNTVLINAGTFVDAAQDVYLTASEGDPNLYSYGISSDYYREAAEDVVNFFGDIVGADDVSLSTEVGRTARATRDLVTLNGRVTAGARHRQRLTVNANGSIFIADDGVNYEVIPDYDPAEALRAYIAVLEAELEASADSGFIVQRQAAIARLEQLVAGLGGETIDLVRINDVFAAGGNVLVEAEVLSGSGTITANGDALIEIINNSRAYLEVGDLLIPFRNGGELFVRGASVSTNDMITAFNVAGIAAQPVYATNPPGTASFSLDIDGPGGTDPSINIENRYVGTQAGLTGDLLVSGVIENLTGTARLLTADGNIYVFGEVNARTVDIRSGGDFFLVAAIDDFLTNVDSPIGVYADYFADIEAANGDGCGYDGDACTLPFVTRQGEGQILGIGSVYIYANTLNVNGKIQSGVTDWDLTISEDFDDFFELLSPVDEIATVYVPPGIGGHGSTFGNWINPATGQPYVTGNGILRFDRVNRHFIVDPMVTKGGTVELVGDIISTGGGEILAAHGFGRVNVVSGVDLPVYFNTVSTGYGDDGAAGLIRIIDTARPGAIAGTFVTTEFRQNANGDIVRTTLNAGAGISLGVAIPGVTTAQYAIEGDWAVENRVGTSIERTFTDTYERLLDQNGTVVSEGLVGGGVISTVDPDTEVPVLTTTPTLWDDRTLIYFVNLLGGSSAGFSSTPTYEFVGEAYLPALDSVQDTNGLLLRETETDWATTGVRAGSTAGTVFVVQQRTESRTYRWPEYALHTIPANLPIDVGFHGYTTAELNINTRGDALFTGGVYNRGGLTQITATEGAILTTAPSVVFDTNRLILSAGDEIGRRVELLPTPLPGGIGGGGGGIGGALSGGLPTTLAPLNVDVADGFAFTALAGDRIKVEELSGDMAIIAVDSANRASVELIAEGGILRHDNAPEGISFVNGGDLHLTARGGAIGNAASLAPLWIESTTITATAAGEVALYQSGSDLNVNTIGSGAGDVTIVVSGGAIRDANTFARIDERAEQGLLEALWDELGLRGNPYADGTPNTRGPDALANYENARTAEYQGYWYHRIADPAAIPSGKVELLPYDPTFQVRFDQTRIDQLTAAGLDAVAIKEAEAAETLAFHAAHGTWGGEPFALDFAYKASVAESAEILGGAVVSAGRLGLGLRRSLILPVTDTVTEIETPNITGRNVNLMADIDIGEQIAPQTFLAADGFTEAARLALWTAERADIRITPGESFSVRSNEDLDVEAAGHLNAIAGRDVFVGSESAVRLQTLFAGRSARLKTAGGITGQLSGGMLVNATGKTIVLEGGDGGIGAALAPILVAQASDGSISARATGDVRIATARDTLRAADVFDPLTLLTTVLAPDVQAEFTDNGFGGNEISGRGSLSVFDIFSQGDVVITALGGDILDANADAAADMLAQNFTLTAGGSIGALGDPLEIAPSGAEAAINALANTGNIDLAVTAGNVMATALGSVQGDTRLTVAAGDLRLSGSGGIAAIGAGGNLNLSVAGTITGRDGVALDLQATGISSIFAGGDIGSAATPLVTRFTDPILGSGYTATLGVFDLVPDDATPVSAWFVNDGDMQLTAIGLDPASSVFGLINNGTVHIDNPFFIDPEAVLTLDADRINIAALGLGETGSASTIRIEENIAFDGRALTLAAAGRVWVADDKALNLGGTVSVLAEGFRMDNSGPLAKSGSDPLSIVTRREIRTQDIIAPDAAVTLAAETPSGVAFVEIGDLVARTAEITAFSISAREIAADEIILLADFGIGAEVLAPGQTLVAKALAIGEPDAPVTVRANPALSTVELDGGLSLAVTVQGGPITFDLLRAGFDDDGLLAALIDDGSIDLADIGSGPEGFGINVTSSGGVAIAGQGVVTNGAQVTLIAARLDLDAPIATAGGPVTLTSTQGPIMQRAGGKIVAGTGAIALDSASDIVLASATSAAADDAITLRAAGALSGIGAGPFVQATHPDGRLTIDTGKLLASGPQGFVIEAARLSAVVLDGALQIHALGPVLADLLRAAGGGLIDLFATGDLMLAGPVESGLPKAAHGPVVLTSLGAITGGGTVPSLLAGDLFLHAFGGALGTKAAPIVFGSSEVTTWHLGAATGLWMDLGSAGLSADYIVAETGSVTLTLGAASSVGRLGASETDATGAPLAVLAPLAPGESVDTLPALATPVIAPTEYRPMILAQAGGGGDTGGGDTGGGDTGGGDTGGGDTGGGDTGGGDTGGGDTGSGDTGGGDTGDGETGSGDTGGGDTGGGDTGGGDPGGGDTGGGDTGGGDTGGGDTGGGDTGGGDTGGGDTGGGDTGGGDTGGGDTGGGDTGGGDTGGGDAGGGGGSLFDPPESVRGAGAPFAGGRPAGAGASGLHVFDATPGRRVTFRFGNSGPPEDEDDEEDTEE